MALEGV